MSIRVIILAAGQGKRMKMKVPKALVEIAGRPMVAHLLDSVADSGLDERPIVVVAPDTLENFHEELGDRFDYVIQEEQLGTGHAVATAEIAAGAADHVIVLYGDHPFLTAEHLSNLKEMHLEHKPVISMITTKVPNFEDEYGVFKNWGRIRRDDLGRVVGVREAKDAAPEELAIKEVNPSLYCFDSAWLFEHLPEIKNKNASGEYYLTDLVGMAIEEGSDVVTAPAEPFEVIGINTPEELKLAEKILG